MSLKKQVLNQFQIRVRRENNDLILMLLIAIICTLESMPIVAARSYSNGLVFYDLQSHAPYLPPTVSVFRGRGLASVKYSAKGSIWSTFGQPCDCHGVVCGCCAGLKVDQYKFDQKICANMTFVPKKDEALLEVYLNERSTAKYGVSARNPSPFCIPIMMGVPMAMCVQMTNVQMVGNNLNMCMDFVVRLASTDLFEMHFQCMRMGLDGVMYVDKNGQQVIPSSTGSGSKTEFLIESVYDIGDDAIETDIDEEDKAASDEYYDELEREHQHQQQQQQQQQHEQKQQIKVTDSESQMEQTVLSIEDKGDNYSNIMTSSQTASVELVEAEKLQGEEDEDDNDDEISLATITQKSFVETESENEMSFTNSNSKNYNNKNINNNYNNNNSNNNNNNRYETDSDSNSNNVVNDNDDEHNKDDDNNDINVKKNEQITAEAEDKYEEDEKAKGEEEKDEEEEQMEVEMEDDEEEEEYKILPTATIEIDNSNESVTSSDNILNDNYNDNSNNNYNDNSNNNNNNYNANDSINDNEHVNDVVNQFELMDLKQNKNKQQQQQHQEEEDEEEEEQQHQPQPQKLYDLTNVREEDIYNENINALDSASDNAPDTALMLNHPNNFYKHFHRVK